MKTILFYATMAGHSKYFAEQFIKEELKTENFASINLDEKLNDSMKKDNLKTWFSDTDKWLELIKENENIIIAAPMWNLQAAPMMTELLNKLSYPGITFKYTPTGLEAIYKDEFKNKKVTIIGTSGSKKEYLPESSHNSFQVIADAFTRYVGLPSQTIWFDGVDMPEVKELSLEEKWKLMKK